MESMQMGLLGLAQFLFFMGTISLLTGIGLAIGLVPTTLSILPGKQKIIAGKSHRLIGPLVLLVLGMENYLLAGLLYYGSEKGLVFFTMGQLMVSVVIGIGIALESRAQLYHKIKHLLSFYHFLMGFFLWSVFVCLGLAFWNIAKGAFTSALGTQLTGKLSSEWIWGVLTIGPTAAGLSYAVICWMIYRRWL